MITIQLSQTDMILLLALLTVAAGVVCFAGFRIYKLALALIGFAVGFSRSQYWLSYLTLPETTTLILQLVIALLCAVLSWCFVRLGIFIGAYHFAQLHISAILTSLLAQQLDIPDIAYPLFSTAAGAGIAWLCAYLAVKAERPVVVILTSVLGAFAVVEILRWLLPFLPADAQAILQLPEAVFLAAKALLALAGIAVQRPVGK